jgi:hypothetical protein
MLLLNIPADSLEISHIRLGGRLTRGIRPDAPP